MKTSAEVKLFLEELIQKYPDVKLEDGLTRGWAKVEQIAVKMQRILEEDDLDELLDILTVNYFMQKLPPLFTGKGKQLYNPKGILDSNKVTFSTMANAHKYFNELLNKEITSIGSDIDPDWKEDIERVFSSNFTENAELNQGMRTILDKVANIKEGITEVDSSKIETVVGDVLDFKTSLTLQGRKNLYDYWKGIYLGMKIDLKNTKIDIPPQLEEIYKELNGVKLASYVVMAPDTVTVKMYRPATSARILINSIYEDKDIERLLNPDAKMKGPEEFIDSETGETQTEGPTFDEFQASVEEYDKEVDLELRDVDGLDPLLALEYVTDKEGRLPLVLADDEVREQVEKQLNYILSTTKLTPFMGPIIEQELNEVMDKISGQVVERDSYYFPLMGKTNNLMDTFENADGPAGKMEVKTFVLKMVVNTTETGSTISFEEDSELTGSASQVAQQVNSINTDFFRNLVIQAEVTSGRRYRTGEAPTTPAERKASRNRNTKPVSEIRAERGGTLPGQKGRLPAGQNVIPELSALLNKYFFEPLRPKNMFGRESPSFAYSKFYTNLRKVGTIDANPAYQTISRRLAETSSIGFESDDMEDLMKFFRNYSQLFRENNQSTVLDVLEEAALAFTKVAILGVSETESGRRQEITKRTKSIRNFFAGEFRKWLDARSIPSDNKIFMNAPLDKYAPATNETFSQALDALIEMVEDEDFQEYARDEGIKYASGLRLAIQNLKMSSDDLELSKAYIEALDLLKTKRGEAIYKAYRDTDNLDDMDYIIGKMKGSHNVDLYARDIERIVSSQDSFSSIAKAHGIDEKLVYEIKGLFRPVTELYKGMYDPRWDSGKIYEIDGKKYRLYTEQERKLREKASKTMGSDEDQRKRIALRNLIRELNLQPE